MITLVLGGTRSGKSAVAESIAAVTGEAVTYLATARVDPADVEHVARVAAHRSRRPPEWTTVEATDPSATAAGGLAAQMATVSGTVLVDSLGTWLTQHHDFVVDSAELVAALVARSGSTVLVSEEVGLAVHPPSDLGRRYVDALGALNQEVAAVADRVVLVVAGRVLELGRP